MTAPKPTPPTGPAGAGSPDLSILPTTARLPLAATPPTTTPSTEHSLLEPYARFRSQPLNALQELGLHAVGEGWRSYERVVGQEIFYAGFSEQMKTRVLAQPALRAKIGALAQRRVEVEIHAGSLGPMGPEGEAAEFRARRRERRAELEAQLARVADDWTDHMICKMESKLFIRWAYYAATQLLTRAYHQGIHVSGDEVRRLREVAEAAERKKQSIIFLPCHRSHVDYVSLQLVCYRLGLALPTVVAGDNLNFPLVGAFLQHAGAMWIRRSFGDDQLYTTLVQAYMDTLLQNGYNIECFVEGGRSRTGKLLPPKFGILRFFLESILSGRVDDAIVCPVSTQYDKVIEVDSYVRELLGRPKPKEDLASFLSASNVLSLKLGRVDVRFHEPWSLRAFVHDQRARLVAASAEPLADAPLHRRLLATLGYKVLADINAASVVMPTALVGTVLLTLRGRGVGQSELVRRVDWLCSRVVARGGRVAHFAGHTTHAVVERALDVLGANLVGRIDGLAEPTFFAADRFQLSFYRNMTIHLFISQALVCAALYTAVKHGGPEAGGPQLARPALRDYVFFLSQLFRAEFIFPATQSLEETLEATLRGLEADRVLQCVRTDDDGSVAAVRLHPAERASGRENFDFYCFCIWPFIEASWLGAISLFMLTPPVPSSPSTPVWLDLKAVQDQAQLLGKTLYHQGDLSYFEAVNKEALKNAFARQEEEGVIEVVRGGKDGSGAARVRLNPAWTPRRSPGSGDLVPDGRLWDLTDRISQARLEGKNRRDDEMVAGRVLALADRVGAGLWEAAATAAAASASDPSVGGVEGESDDGAAPGAGTKKTQRRKGLRTRAHL